MPLYKASNGENYRLTKGELDLHYMIEVARALRSGSGRGLPLSAAERSVRGPSLHPPDRLTSGARNGDSPSLESHRKFEERTDTLESQPKIEDSPNKASDIKESTNGERTSQHSGDAVLS